MIIALIGFNEMHLFIREITVNSTSEERERIEEDENNVRASSEIIFFENIFCFRCARRQIENELTQQTNDLFLNHLRAPVRFDVNEDANGP